MLEESTGNFSATRSVYDWYQTNTHIIVNIMLKNLKETDVKVKLIDETLDITCDLADGSIFKLHFNLFRSIYVQDSNWSVTPSKLEIKLKKTDRKRWQSLEQLPEKSKQRRQADDHQHLPSKKTFNPPIQPAPALCFSNSKTSEELDFFTSSDDLSSTLIELLDSANNEPTVTTGIARSDVLVNQSCDVEMNDGLSKE